MVTDADVIVVGLGPGGEYVAGRLAKRALTRWASNRLWSAGNAPTGTCTEQDGHPGRERACRSTARQRAGRPRRRPPGLVFCPRRIREEATDDWDDTVAVERFEGKGGARAWPRDRDQSPHRDRRPARVPCVTWAGPGYRHPAGVPDCQARRHALLNQSRSPGGQGGTGLTDRRPDRGAGTRQGPHGADRGVADPVFRPGSIDGPGNDGFIKLIADAEAGVLAGATSAGPAGGEVLGALAVAVHARVPVGVLGRMIYAYPTFHRAIENAVARLSSDRDQACPGPRAVPPR